MHTFSDSIQEYKIVQVWYFLAVFAGLMRQWRIIIFLNVVALLNLERYVSQLHSWPLNDWSNVLVGRKLLSVCTYVYLIRLTHDPGNVERASSGNNVTMSDLFAKDERFSQLHVIIDGWASDEWISTASGNSHGSNHSKQTCFLRIEWGRRIEQ